jgi:hyperosmotically inducible protein
MNTIKTKIIALAAVVLLCGSSSVFATPNTTPTNEQVGTRQQINNKIRKELVTLPFYGVFDNLAYQVDGSTVTLYGQVVRPVTRSDAERRIKRLPGVERVINQIEVLPLSSFDDAIRYQTYRAVFNQSGLYRYAMSANPSLHIIVNNGHVTLEGVVANKMDKQLAYIAANGVPGVFSVTNNLRTDAR